MAASPYWRHSGTEDQPQHQPRKLPPQVLSNLLWAAFGVNRENGPFGQVGRTAASASNSQEIDLYVALAEGVYLYEAVPTA